MGYADGSGAEDTIYDVELDKPIAKVTWGCTCCEFKQPGDTERGQLIVAALNAFNAQEKAWLKKRKVYSKGRRSPRVKGEK
jgi:hypothetical protein